MHRLDLRQGTYLAGYTGAGVERPLWTLPKVSEDALKLEACLRRNTGARTVTKCSDRFSGYFAAWKFDRRCFRARPRQNEDAAASERGRFPNRGMRLPWRRRSTGV